MTKEGAAIFALVCLGLAFIIAAINLGENAGWSTFASIIIVGGGGLLVAAGVVGTMTSTLRWAGKEIDQLRVSHAAALEQLRRKKPSFVFTFILVGDVVLIIADKAYGGEVLPTIVLSILFLIVFFVANGLATSKGKGNRIAGYFVYVLGFIALPLSALHFHGISIGTAWDAFLEFEVATKIAVVLTALICIVMPALFASAAQKEGD